MKDQKNAKIRQRILREAMGRNDLILKLKKLIPETRDSGLYLEAQAIAELVDFIENSEDDETNFLTKLFRRNRVKEIR